VIEYRGAPDALFLPVTPKRILVIRLSAIGDVVMASPLIHALRTRYPDARLAWMVLDGHQDLLAANPELDRVFAWPRARWQQLARRGRLLRLGREMWRFLAELRGEHFDMVIDAQGLLKSALWARLSGATRRIGLDSREGSARLMTEVVHSTRGDKRISSEYLHLAEALGLPANPFPMVLASSEDDQQRAAALLPAGDRPFAVFCPFSTRPQKNWPASHWQELAAGLGRPVVILGGPRDREAARALAADIPQMTPLAGDTSLGTAAAVIRRAGLLVGVDTGLTHMGIAAGVPTVVLFGSTFPYHDFPGDNFRALYKQFPCSPCKRRPTCGGRFDCMSSIRADEVMVAAGELAV
jgi:heptosyltransferase-1